MVRGRAGGTGAAFNVGEATVTRCTVETESGHVGHAYVLGRDHAHAEAAAVCDAMLQDERQRPLLTALLAALEAAQLQDAERKAAEAAATRVEFFTMVRGEG
jgi:alpha-D-ribose 1-methylphosphonate 5-triphosphate synthase subunit PhnG